VTASVPEVERAPAVRILEATGVKFEWGKLPGGAREAFAKYKEYIPKELNDFH